MSFLLDTCVISDLSKSHPHPLVTGWLQAQPEVALHLSVLTLGELEKGITMVPSGSKRERLKAWVDKELRVRFEGRILPVSDEVARTWGRIQGDAEKARKRMPVVDSLIAATALAHELVLVTRNSEDMARSGARIFDPWTAPS